MEPQRCALKVAFPPSYFETIMGQKSSQPRRRIVNGVLMILMHYEERHLLSNIPDQYVVSYFIGDDDSVPHTRIDPTVGGARSLRDPN